MESGGTLTPQFVQDFAAEWIAAWNSHDLERILAHYSEDFRMSSPVIRKVMGEPSGTLAGKAAVRTYWARALAANPGLKFRLVEALGGVDSITIVYEGHRGLSAEVFFFGAGGLVERAHAHYAEPVA